MNELVPYERPKIELEPGYYAARKKYKTSRDHIRRGQVVYLLRVDEKDAHWVRGEHEYYSPLDEFAEYFEADPEGAAHRANEVAVLMAEVGTLQAESLREEMAARAINPHVDRTSALVTTADAQVETAKRSMATIRNTAEHLRRDLKARANEIKAFAEEQRSILESQTRGLMEVLEKAQEAVWTINLYLGSEEKIERIREGESAPADTPITLRQLVLYMDEECAAAAEDGGIDARSMDKFDEWLLEDPAHLQQVLPEPKGLVILKPRRTDKDYNTGNAWSEVELNKANKVTYFLLRNGENLYYMWTNWNVGERFVPRADEFTKMFVGTRLARRADPGSFAGSYVDEKYQMEPGSQEWMDAEKKADKHRRHYMRAALILQGLIDRTTIFAPMAKPVAVNDPATYDEGLINIVLDGDIMLSDGRERFNDWIKRINGELNVGNRVVGAWHNWNNGLRSQEGERSYRNYRIGPPNAGYPDDSEVHTISDKKGDSLYFYFKREGQRWVDWGEQDYQRRASCRLERTDQFMINFDAATEDDLRFYLGSRLDRHNYMWMFPTLRTALTLKAEERAAEAPFALLLAGEIAKAHKVDVATATEQVPELITWWKFKNKTHRALTADDSKALRMIVKEFGHRAEQERVRARRTDTEDVVGLIKADFPHVLVIAHKSWNEYVALVPANDENIFVHEQTWTKNGAKSVAEWRTVDSRFQRWSVLYTSSRWADWQVNVPRRDVLSDPERDALLELAWAKAGRRGYHAEPKAIRRLAATIGRQDELRIFWFEGAAKVPEGLLLTGDRPSGPEVRMGTVHWHRSGDDVRLGEFADSGISFNRNEPPWEGHYWKPKKVLWTDSDALADYQAEARKADVAEKQRAALASKADGYYRDVIAAWDAKAEAAAYAKFLADYGDPELWEGHKKSLKLPQVPRMEGLDRALDILIERGIEPAPGATVLDVLEQAGKIAGKHIEEGDSVLNLVVRDVEGQ